MTEQPYVLVDDLVVFATNRGIELLPSERFGWSYGGQIDLRPIYDNPKWPLVTAAFEEMLGIEPQRLTRAVQIAIDHFNDPLLVEACCGVSGPLANCGVISFEEYLIVVAEHERQREQIAAFRETSVGRRVEFGRRRADLIVEMLDNGVAYRCAHTECSIVDHLTVGHIMPLSRGGTNDVSNLQFMCRSHNSAKGNRI